MRNLWGMFCMFCAGLILCCIGVAIAQTQAHDQGGAAAATAASGAPASISAGQEIVMGKGKCLQCHWVSGQGSRLGSDLNQVASQRAPAQLRAALLTPPASVTNSGDPLYRVVTREGRIVVGKLLNQDMYSLQMLDTKDNLIAFSRADIRESGFIAAPQMPSSKGVLSDAEIDDVVAYLESLKNDSGR